MESRDALLPRYRVANRHHNSCRAIRQLHDWARGLWQVHEQLLLE